MLGIKFAKIKPCKIVFYPLGNLKDMASFFALFMSGILLILFFALSVESDKVGRHFFCYFSAAVYSVLFIFYQLGQLKIVVDKEREVLYYQWSFKSQEFIVLQSCQTGYPYTH